MQRRMRYYLKCEVCDKYFHTHNAEKKTCSKKCFSKLQRKNYYSNIKENVKKECSNCEYRLQIINKKSIYDKIKDYIINLFNKIKTLINR